MSGSDTTSPLIVTAGRSATPKLQHSQAPLVLPSGNLSGALTLSAEPGRGGECPRPGTWHRAFGSARALLLALLVLCFCTGARAQLFSNLTYSVQPSASQILVGSNLTYSIYISNNVFELFNVFVTNMIPASATLVSAGTTNFNWFIVTNRDSVVFSKTQVFFGETANFNVTVMPTNTGTLISTNSVSASPGNTLFTNVTTQVVAPATDLAVSLVGPAAGVLVNDWITYQVTVNNSGANSASSVMLTNTLPSGTTLIGISPSQAHTQVGNNVLVNLGTLAPLGSRTLTFQVQPTVAGAQTLSVSVGSANVQDTTPANNQASTNFNVGAFGPLLQATNASAMVFDPQTALMKQIVRLSNTSTSAVDSARVIVSGLTNWLRNAVGTNDGHPFVVYSTTLGVGQSVDLVLEYFIPSRLPINVPDSAYTAVGVPTNSPVIPSGTAIDVARKISLESGNILIEFPATPGRTYTILYSDNASLTNALPAQPSIVAQADRVQWLDDGPPKTLSTPATNAMRFYRVILNP